MVGLANPGAEYDGTRHNVGGEVVELLADRHGAKLRKGKERAMVDEVTVDGRRLALAIPLTYMNLSRRGGRAARPPPRHRRPAPPRDRARRARPARSARLRVKVGGGLAGNNGLKSVKAHLHTDDFVRVRIGIGKPPGKAQGADHVLKKPGKARPRRARRRRPGGRRRRRVHPHRRPRRRHEPLQHPAPTQPSSRHQQVKVMSPMSIRWGSPVFTSLR